MTWLKFLLLAILTLGLPQVVEQTIEVGTETAVQLKGQVSVTIQSSQLFLFPCV